MADEPDNLVLRLLEGIRQQNNRLADTLDVLKDDVRDLKIRTTGVEEGLAGVNRRLDRVDGRLDHIERRLELVDAH